MTNEELAIEIKGGNRLLLPQLWEQLYRLLCQYANRYYVRLYDPCVAAGVTVDDLVQESYFALLDAVAAWEPESGHKLSTYLKYPCQNRFNALAGIRTVKARAEALNCAASLDEPLPGTEDITLADTLVDPVAGDAFHAVEDNDYNAALRKALDTAIDTLPTNEQTIIRGEYFQGEKLKDIAATINLSYSRCCWLRNTAYRHLRRGKAYKLLEPYRDDIISTVGYRGTLGGFRQSWTSSTELAAMRLIDADEIYNQAMARIEQRAGVR